MCCVVCLCVYVIASLRNDSFLTACFTDTLDEKTQSIMTNKGKVAELHAKVAELEASSAEKDALIGKYEAIVKERKGKCSR